VPVRHALPTRAIRPEFFAVATRTLGLEDIRTFIGAQRKETACPANSEVHDRRATIDVLGHPTGLPTVRDLLRRRKRRCP
jgi:hypothetical protein